jgi:peptidoglycan-associated lipoprotein
VKVKERVMKIWIKMLVLWAIGSLLLAGCGGDEALKQDAEATAGQAEMPSLQPETQGMEGPPGFRGSTLGSPGQYPGGSSSASGRVIYFDYDSDEIKPEYRSVIEALAAYMASHPNAVATLEGHADERGSREYNLALGERRAIAVQRQIGLMNASRGQLRTVSYGEERPAAADHDEQSYFLNRRVEIIY